MTGGKVVSIHPINDPVVALALPESYFGVLLYSEPVFTTEMAEEAQEEQNHDHS